MRIAIRDCYDNLIQRCREVTHITYHNLYLDRIRGSTRNINGDSLDMCIQAIISN